MKVFIPYEHKRDAIRYEGARLRKTLKGECELAGLRWVDSLLERPDIAHLTSLEEEMLLIDAKWRRIPCVVSAFYSENEEKGAFLEKETNGTPKVSERGVKFLNRADLVLVPNEMMRNVCLSSGVTSPIRVHPASIRLDRFSLSSPEAGIFPRYYGVRPGDKIVVSTGEYDDKNTMEILSAAAKACPDIQFYFFGSSSRPALSVRLALGQKSAPKNLHFKPIVQDDVYRSALICAGAYLSLNSLRCESMALLEAMASKTQIIALYNHFYEPLIKDKETAWVAMHLEEVVSYLHSLYSPHQKSTIIAGWQLAKSRSIDIASKELLSIYEELLGRTKTN